MTKAEIRGVQQKLASVLTNLARNAGGSGSKYAYINASDSILHMSESEFYRHMRRKDWETIKGIAERISDYIEQYLEKGYVEKQIDTELGRKGNLRIRPGLQQHTDIPVVKVRLPRKEYTKYANRLKKYLTTKLKLETEIVGSYRRKEPKISNLDIIVGGNKTTTYIMGKLEDIYPNMEVLSVRKNILNFALDDNGSTYYFSIRLVDKRSFGAAVLWYTGSANFIIFLKAKASDLGYTLKEDGLYKGQRKIVANSEDRILAKLGVDVPPSKRNFD